MKQNKNIHVLPTDKPSELYINMQGDLSKSNSLLLRLKSRNIYITSDEEINKDTKTCWCIDISYNELVLHQGVLPSYHYKHYKKIIMTTDKSINVLCSCGKDCGAKESGVQAIPDEFLEWFVKNPSCEEVEVEEFEPIYGHQNNSSSILYKIIIPKEEPNYNMKKEILIEMMKQDEELGLYEETVEEYFLSSIKNMLQFNNDALAIRFMEKYYHAKKEQEKVYSEEEAGELVYNIMGEYAKRENIFFKGDLINNLFNKFKKQIK